MRDFYVINLSHTIPMKKFLLLLLVPFIFLNCEDTHDHDDDHADVVGFEIMNGTNELVHQHDGEVHGSISLTVNTSLSELKVVFINPDDKPVAVNTEEYGLQVLSANPAVVSISDIHVHDGEFEFSLNGVSEGTTEITVSLMHGNHADFESRPISVTVTPAN